MEYNPRKPLPAPFGEGNTAEERAALLQQYSSILDMIRPRAEDLKRSLGASDRAVIDDYLESMREIERRVEKTEKQDLSAQTARGAGRYPDQFDDQLNLMFDMMALAYQADLTAYPPSSWSPRSPTGPTTTSACLTRSIRSRTMPTIRPKKPSW